MTALLITALLWLPQPGFNARWVSLPPSIDVEVYRAAVKAAARPSFCMWEWDYPGCGCRVS